MRLKTKIWKKYSDILENAVEYKKEGETHIYFLLEDNKVVYIGQSDKLQPRIYAHSRDKEFNRVSSFQCLKEEANEIEAGYVLKMLPKYNKCVPPNKVWKNFAQLKRYTGLKEKGLKRFLHKYRIMPFGHAFGEDYYVVRQIDEALKQEEETA